MNLSEYATTDRQRELIAQLDAGDSVSAAADAIGMEYTNACRMLRRLKAKAGQDNDLTLVEEHAVKRQNRELKQQLAEVLESTAQDAKLASLVEATANRRVSMPKWLGKPKRSGGVERSIATAFLSDTHFDEHVHADQINYVNGYDRTIAEQRLDRFFRSTARLSADFINGIQIDGLIMPLGGDIVSGNIHEELAETNEARILETVIHFAGLICAGLYRLVEQYETVYVPCVVGNHGRLHGKPRMKNRVMDNYDWLIYKIIEREFEGVEGVTVNVASSADARYSVYSTRYQLTHGDQFRGGTGIAGMLSPLMLGDARKRKREVATGTPYDYLVMGHWHQLAYFKGLIVNGSLKGYDEYAAISNFDFEPPQQAFWLTDPKWGRTLSAPIHVLGKDEPWRRSDKGVHHV